MPNVKNSNQQVNNLLEQYVYSLLEKHIDQVDNDTQSQLIKLYSDIHDQVYAESAKSVTLPQPTTQAHNYYLEQVAFIERLLMNYQSSMKATRANIQRMDALIKRLEHSLPLTSRGVSLINHYQYIRERFVVSLEKSQSFCQKELFNRIVQSV